MIKKIESAVDQLRIAAEAESGIGNVTAYSAWKEREALYAELISDLNAVKKAWRHTSAHFRQRYTAQQAEKVLDRVGDFMRQAAKLI